MDDGVYVTSYVYDSANQLIRENNEEGNFTHTWEYDNAGNILCRKEYAFTTGSLTGVTPTDVVNYTYDTELGWGDLLVGYDGNTITHDGVGNPLSDGTWTYTWEHGRQLKSMTDGEETWTYQYNADGLRTHRYSADTSYYYSYVGDKLGYYSTDDAYFSIAYDATGMPYSLCRNGVEYYYYVLNLQGDVIAINDDEGNTVVYYVYDAWGNLVSMTDDSGCGIGTANVLRYRSYVYDTETGLYYVSSRYYDPEIGRFINADGAYDTNQGVLGHNMYAYCLNNPVNMHDPDGRCSRFLGFLWKIDCKQASCPDSKNYVKPKAVDPIGSYNKGQGYVYVVTEDQLDIIEEKEKNVVVIVDKRTSSDPNMQIQDSYKITKTKQQKEIAQLMLDYTTSNPVEPAWSRTLDSLVEEWKLHNFAHSWGIKRDRTADCDFNNADEGMGFWDFVGR